MTKADGTQLVASWMDETPARVSKEQIEKAQRMISRMVEDPETAREIRMALGLDVDWVLKEDS